MILPASKQRPPYTDGYASDEGGWARPADWLPLPPDVPGEEKVSLLCAVREDGSNFITVGLGGKYLVDWGDGSAPTNHNSNAKASHNLSWAGCSSATLTSEGFRQAMITITPQVATPDHLSAFGIWYADVPPPGAWTGSPVLEAWVSLPYCSTTGLNSAFSGRARMMRFCTLRNIGGATYLSSVFANCVALEEVRIPANTSGLGFLVGTFTGCSSMIRAPFFDTSNVTNIGSLFSGCLNLKEIPPYDFRKVLNANAAFTSCRELTRTAPVDLSAATDVSGLYNECSSLVEVGDLDFRSALTALQLFTRCFSLKRVGTVDLRAATTLNQAFFACSALRSVAGITTGAALVNVNSCFYTSTALEEPPLFGTSEVTDAGYFLSETASLRKVPAFNLGKATTITNIFSGAVTLGSMKATGIKETFSLLNAALTAASLNEIYTNLATVTGKTITVTGNPGTTGDDPTIATAKGWTVIG